MSNTPDLNETLREFSHLPKFEDGRINYREAKKAPVITCFIKFNDKILLLKRSDKVATYKGKWNAVAGYIDENKPLSEKIMEELKEEIGIEKDNIKDIIFGKPFNLHDDKIDTTWIVHPSLAELNSLPKIKLDFEHIDLVWINPSEMGNYDTVPNLDKSWDNLASFL